jgi:hypothetical protein
LLAVVDEVNALNADNRKASTLRAIQDFYQAQVDKKKPKQKKENPSDPRSASLPRQTGSETRSSGKEAC